MAVGKQFGVVKKATAIILDNKLKEDSFVASAYHETVVYEKVLESLLNAADDIASKGRSGKAVINMSHSGRREHQVIEFWDTMCKFHNYPWYNCSRY
jgi:hypothetical protein